MEALQQQKQTFTLLDEKRIESEKTKPDFVGAGVNSMKRGLKGWNDNG
nr:hypothetical protein [Ferroglobus placidus]